jgi:hypothetical protein
VLETSSTEYSFLAYRQNEYLVIVCCFLFPKPIKKFLIYERDINPNH